MYLSIWHLLLEQLTAFSAIVILLYFNQRDPLLRTLKGSRAMLAAFATQLVLFLAPTLVRSFPPRWELLLHTIGHILLVSGLFLVVRDLASLKILRNALEDPESGLPNRSRWERYKRDLPPITDAERYWEVQVQFERIETVRKLSESAKEKAFFDWLGSVITRSRKDDRPGFIARTGIRTLSILVKHRSADEAGYTVERFMGLLMSDLRSGGFSLEYSYSINEPAQTVF